MGTIIYACRNRRQTMLIKAGILLRMHQANERRRYNVTSSLIGWAHEPNDPCKSGRNHIPYDVYVHGK